METTFKNQKPIIRLLLKVFTGLATDDEQEEVKIWRASSEANEQTFQEIETSLFTGDSSGMEMQADVTGAYWRVRQKCKQRRQQRVRRWIGGIAASLLLPIVVSIFFLSRSARVPEQENTIAMNIVAPPILPGEAKAELLLADGSSIHLQGENPDSLSEQGTSIITGQHGLSYEQKESIDRLVYNTLRIPRGGEYTLTLEDGTVVYLNSESQLQYPIQFVGNERRVYLSGEAYFEVKKDAGRPFIVATQKTKVEVLGTSFNLRSYEDEEAVAATLVEGKVRFVAEDGGQVSLKPGEQGVWSEKGQLTKQEVDTYLYTAWKDGNFVFRKQPLEEVMRVIARWYDIDYYFIDASQSKITFTGNVRRYDNFCKILEMLELAGGTRFEIQGKSVFIRKK